MAVLMLPFELRAVLRGLQEPTEFVDDDGTLLGFYRPVPHADDELYDKVRAQIDLKEIEQRLQSKEPVVPFENIKQRLESLRKPG